MTANLKERFVQKLNKVCGNNKMEEIRGLSDNFVSAFDGIVSDSYPGVDQWPPALNEDAIRRLGSTLDDRQAISLVFLLANDTEQAFGICQKIEAKTFKDPLGPKKSAAELFIGSFLETAKRCQKPGWHIQLLSAFHLIGRLKCLNQELGNSDRIVLKDTEYEKLAKRLSPFRYQIHNASRVLLFEIAQELTSQEAAELYTSIKMDLEKSSGLDRDAASWSVKKIDHRETETMLLQLLQPPMKPTDLIGKLEKCLPQIVKDLSQEEFEETFRPIFDEINVPEKDRDSGERLNPLKLKSGLCLIVNNHEFADGGEFSKRDGSCKDAADLASVWTKFGCDVTSVENRSALQMKKDFSEFREKLNKIGSSKDTSFYMVICILSHGRRRKAYNVDEVMGVDGEGIPTEDIVDWFADGNVCPGMAGKFKLFLIQACRGDKPQGNAYVSTSLSRRPEDEIVTDGATPRAITRESVPNKSLFLIFNSTLQNCVSFRSKTEGSFFVQAICKALPKYCSQDDLNTILTYANRDLHDDLKESSNQSMTQVGEMTSSLFSQVFLPKPKLQF